MNGGSTGHLPIQVRMKNFPIIKENRICDKGRKDLALLTEVWRIGTRNKTRIDPTRAITPPSLFGMDRRMA